MKKQLLTLTVIITTLGGACMLDASGDDQRQGAPVGTVSTIANRFSRPPRPERPAPRGTGRTRGRGEVAHGLLGRVGMLEEQLGGGRGRGEEGVATGADPSAFVAAQAALLNRGGGELLDQGVEEVGEEEVQESEEGVGAYLRSWVSPRAWVAWGKDTLDLSSPSSGSGSREDEPAPFVPQGFGEGGEDSGDDLMAPPPPGTSRFDQDDE